LSIVTNLLDLMDGKIEVESQLNKGTVIRVKLPIEIVNEEKVETDDAELSNLVGGSMQVLLVEDNNVNQIIAQKFLTSDGHKVVCAINGQQAVDLVESNEFDLVLMDINMPIMDGKEATTIIRKQYDSETLPIIALTASASREDMEHYRDIGMNDTLSKPIRKERLTQALMPYRRKLLDAKQK